MLHFVVDEAFALESLIAVVAVPAFVVVVVEMDEIVKRHNAVAVVAKSVHLAAIEIVVVLANDCRTVVQIAVATSSVAYVVVVAVFDYVLVAENMVPIISLGVRLVKADGTNRANVFCLGLLARHC